MINTKLKIFHNLKNFYILSYEIKEEKNLELKALKQQIAKTIYGDLQISFYSNKVLFRRINSLFNAVKNLNDVKQITY
tara:strand:+ start:315 stop:548 length:234 start_codon:yes stop_codon:yes gene_type:complete